MRLAHLSLSVFVLATALAGAARSQEPVDLDAVTRLRAEGFERSQVMETAWYLTDVHGPRLTNSPQQRRAAEWARGRLEEFGLVDAAVEPWGEFGLGWSFERCVVELVAPSYMPLIAFPKAWTLGLEAPVEGVPLHVTASTEEELEALRGTLAGRIVLVGEVRDVPAHFDPTARRHEGEDLAELETFPVGGPADPARAARRAQSRAGRALREKRAALFREEGVALVLEADGGRRGDYGVVLLGGGGSREPEEERGLPQVVLAAEHFNRIARLLEHGQAVRVRADVQTTFHPGDTVASNVVAEIPGSDPALKDELVLMGGHFDSWHAGTGATDNGASCAVVMEAARLIVATGLAPRRTIRVALWTGEEQGLLGSRAYVKNHFADRETMELQPDHGRVSGYYNLDNGAGRIRGVYLQGNAAVAPIFEAWLAPFHDLAAGTLTLRDTGSTDHIAFDAVGLPGFQFVQDPMDYGARTHHSNQDLYERIHEGDVQQAAVILATFAYHTAMRDEPLPRKPLPEARAAAD